MRPRLACQRARLLRREFQPPHTAAAWSRPDPIDSLRVKGAHFVQFNPDCCCYLRQVNLGS
jgi:hypothetical protein